MTASNTGGGRAGVQRVQIDLPGVEENILQPYDQAGTTTTDYEPHRYSTGTHYDLSRTDTAVDVAVKIHFVQPDGTAIPDGDPRRQFATDLTSHLVDSWNDRFSLTDEPGPGAGGAGAGGVAGAPSPDGGAPAGAGAGSEAGPGPAPTDGGGAGEGSHADVGTAAPADGGGAGPGPAPVTLACRFTASPVFDGGGDSSALVHLFPPSVTADGAPGRRIDAGNWFMTKGAAYPAPQEVIAAHEYGHLIGINDEYSQSNPSMHALLHQASPGGTTSADQQIDAAQTKAMILTALQPALQTAVDAAAGDITADIQASQASLVANLATALTAAWSDGGFQTSLAGVLQGQATAAGKPALATGLSEDLREAATTADPNGIAAAAASAVINAGFMQQILDYVLGQIVAGAHHVDLPIQDSPGSERSMSVNINTSPNVAAAATGTSPIAPDAAALAGAAVGTGGVSGAAPSGAALTPGGDLLAAIGALPARWAAAKGMLAPKVDAMVSAMTQAAVASPADLSGVADRAALTTLEPNLLTQLGAPAASAALSSFLTDQFKPLFQTQLDALAALVQAEVDTQSSGPGVCAAAEDAAGTNPQIAAAVSSVAAAISTLQAPGAPVPAAQTSGAAGAPTTQNVSFTVQSMMGDNNASTGVRADYLQPVADQFNQNCKQSGEPDFRPKLGVGAGPGDYPAPTGGTAMA
jgi:hypothetical protein